MTEPITEVRYDSHTYADPPREWGCTIGSRGRAGDCSGENVQVRLHRTDDTWEDTQWGVCQFIEHRQATTAAMSAEFSALGGRLHFDDDACTTSPRGQLHIRRITPTPEASTMTETTTPEPPTFSITLPGLNNVQRQTLEYLLSGNGTSAARHEAFQHLAEAGAFEPGDSDETTRTLLFEEFDNLPGCSEGKARFRDALGLKARAYRWRAKIVNGGGTLGVVTWVCEHGPDDDVADAEDVLTDRLSLGDLDGAIRSSLYGFDGGDAQVDVTSSLDTELEDVECLGPAG